MEQRKYSGFNKFRCWYNSTTITNRVVLLLLSRHYCYFDSVSKCKFADLICQCSHMLSCPYSRIFNASEDDVVNRNLLTFDYYFLCFILFESSGELRKHQFNRKCGSYTIVRSFKNEYVYTEFF